jgi:hypothetical protein
MGDYLVISAVTTVLKRILEREIESEIGTALNISTQAPHTIKAEPQDSGLNIYLFLVTNNSGYNNYDLPTRDTGGRIVSKQLVGLDLHYLLTPFSVDNDEILTQQILASTIRILHEKSVLTRNIIEHEFGLIETSNPTDKILKSGLAEQNESINLVHKSLSVEELTKLWSSYFQTNYRLSLAYLATPVLIESKKEPIRPLPVQERKIFVQQFRSPMIERIEPTILQWDSNASKRSIRIIGRNLTSENMKVEIVGEPSPIPANLLTIVSDESINVKLPDDLTAGIKRLKIVHGISYENDGVDLDPEHIAYESNTSIFTLAPLLITGFPLQIVKGEKFDLKFKPPLREQQKVQIMIGEQTFSQTFDKNQKDKISIDSNDFPDGKFLFRLRIDGAESFLLSGPDKTYIKPEIVVKP